MWVFATFWTCGNTLNFSSSVAELPRGWDEYTRPISRGFPTPVLLALIWPRYLSAKLVSSSGVIHGVCITPLSIVVVMCRSPRLRLPISFQVRYPILLLNCAASPQGYYKHYWHVSRSPCVFCISVNDFSAW